MTAWVRRGSAMAMMLEGTQVHLRPPQPSDLSFLIDMATRHELAFRWLGLGAAASPASLERDLMDRTSVRFLVMSRQIGQPVALVACYDADLENGHAKVALSTGHHPQSILLGLQGAALFLEYLFAVYQFRRLYIEVPEEWSSVTSAGAFHFARQEARLRDHCYYQGAYHDLLVLAVDREAWQLAAGSLLDEIQDLSG